VEELTSTVFAVIDSLKTFPVDEDYISKVTEAQRRSYETSLKRNRFWLSSLVSTAFRGQDPGLILEYPMLVDSLTADKVRDTARKYFNTGNYIQVVLMPEDTGSLPREP
jgi:zinc protease